MPDLLIRDFPADDLSLLDKQARRVGLSRAEYLRRQLHQTARRLEASVTPSDLLAFTGLVSDLEDEAVMQQAWS